MKKLMKKLFMMLVLMSVSMVGFSQETGIKELIDAFGWETLFNVILPVVAVVFVGVFVVLKKKLRIAGELLIQVANAIEDNKVDANERKDLALKARELFSK
jgi:hypothetical protein